MKDFIVWVMVAWLVFGAFGAIIMVDRPRTPMTPGMAAVRGVDMSEPIMQFDEFMVKMLAAFPEAEVDEDSNGQLIVHTNLKEKPDGIYMMTAEDYGV
jgi:hypothetical protein